MLFYQISASTIHGKRWKRVNNETINLKYQLLLEIKIRSYSLPDIQG